MKKVILYISAILVLLFITATSVIYFYQDEIIQLFVRELNKNLKTKVEVEKINLSLFEKFPQVALSFDQLVITGALPEHQLPLAKAGRLYLTFDFWNIFGGRYKVNEVFLEDADVQVYINRDGDENYQIFTSNPDADGAGGQVDFDLEKIQLKAVNVVYADAKNEQTYTLLARKVDASLQMSGNDLLIALDGGLKSESIQVGNYKYFASKELELASKLVYNLENRNLLIQPSTIQVKQSQFMVAGTFANHTNGEINLEVKGKDTDIQTLVSLLPTQYADQLSVYRSKGKVYFESQIKGATFNSAVPAITIDFGCENASFYQSDINKRIESAYLKGSFSNGKQHNRITSVLKLTSIKGILDNRPFNGNFSMVNFDNPHLAFDVKGELDVASLYAFYPLNFVSNATGILGTNIEFEGKLSDLKNRAVQNFVQTSGEIHVQNLSFQLTNKPLSFREINGDFAFSKSDLLINHLAGKAGNSDFALKGLFRNIMAYLFFREQALQVEAEFSSSFLDFNELLAVHAKSENNTSGGQEEAYQFIISPHLSLDLFCKVGHLQFRKFQASNIQGDLKLSNQIANSRSIRLETANGSLQLNGTVNAREKERILVNSYAEFNELAIDSVFYMFENFNQDFIQDKHLRGKATARVQANMVFNSQLDLDVPTLTADIQTTISNGGLTDFEPMQNLSKFMNRNELANIRFSEMENNIYIKNRTVHIPEMEIRSNVSTISVKGTHTFDQVMDYRLKVPLRNIVGKPTNAADTEEGGANLFLRIKGTSDDYKIAYDAAAVKDNLKENLREEKKEIKTLFKKDPHKEPARQKQTKDTEKEEEYFDF